MDIDNVPIGVKPTNKMSFEQLIEEKLKIQSQLDEEQARFGGRSGGTKPRPPVLLAKKRSTTTLAPPAPTPPSNDQQTVGSSRPVSPAVALPEPECPQPPRHTQQPKQYLRKGEGLQRFQPGAAAKRQKQLQKKQHTTTKRKSSLGGGGNSTTSRTSLPNSVAAVDSTKPVIVNRVVSTAQGRQGRQSIVAPHHQQQQQLNRNGVAAAVAKKQQQQQQKQSTAKPTANHELTSRSRSPSSVGGENMINEDEDETINENRDEEEEQEEEEEEIEFKPISMQTAKSSLVYAEIVQKKVRFSYKRYSILYFILSTLQIYL